MNKVLLFCIRACFKIASQLTPQLAGRLAFRLFCTTFKPVNKSVQHQAILDHAQDVFADATQHNIAYSGGHIAAFEFKPEENENRANAPSTVLIVHGWQSHSAFMNKLITPLLTKGYRVISIDLPGHGQSSGRTFHLPLGVEAIHATINALGEFDRVITHSLGGAVIATTVAGTIPNYPAVEISRLVLISSPDSMTKIFNDFSAMIGLNTAANAALHQNVTRLTGKVTDDFNVAAQLKNSNANMLLIHAPDDKEVPYSEAESIAQKNASAQLKPMPGLGHRRIIGDDDVVATATDFME